jgi:signal transduction histidine kinase
METRREPLLKRLPALFEIPEPDADRARHRIRLMERSIMLPVRLFFVGISFVSFRYSPWTGQISSALDVTLETVQVFFGFYVLLSVLLTLPLFAIRRLPLALVQWSTFTCALADGLLLAAMTLITGGIDSILFWLFLGLILRNAVSVPPGFSQLTLNFSISLCYMLVAVLDIAISSNVDEMTNQTLDLAKTDGFGESIVLRILVLWLTGISCYGVQAFLERQRLAVEEAAEFGAREGQLRSAGRMAAEFAHQIKNPLAIINNTAYSLQRALRQQNLASADELTGIIQEEVARADRVITQIMGYAQLSEGRVEKLDLFTQMEAAIAQVFPPALPTGICLKKDLVGPFPPLLMHRAHLSEILVNLLQNAREALGDKGEIAIGAVLQRGHAIEISIEDSGPGIPADKLEQIFEAYFTTKEKGSGIGLAIVKHNVELYGGTVRVDSALGKGTRFTISFPAKTVPANPST